MLANNRPNHSGVKVGVVDRVAPPDVFVTLVEDVNPQDVLEIRSDKGGPEPKNRERTGAEGQKALNVELTSAAGAGKGGILKLKGKDFRLIRRGMSVYRIRNNALIESVQKNVIGPERFVAAQAMVEAHVGSPLTISVWKDDVCVSLQGSTVQEAANKPSDENTILQKMAKTGGTGVKLETMCSIDGNAFVQMSELNGLRRQAVDEFKAALLSRYRRES